MERNNGEILTQANSSTKSRCQRAPTGHTILHVTMPMSTLAVEFPNLFSPHQKADEARFRTSWLGVEAHFGVQLNWI